jgi:hypothetical protein
MAVSDAPSVDDFLEVGGTDAAVTNALQNNRPIAVGCLLTLPINIVDDKIMVKQLGNFERELLIVCVKEERKE